MHSSNDCDLYVFKVRLLFFPLFRAGFTLMHFKEKVSFPGSFFILPCLLSCVFVNFLLIAKCGFRKSPITKVDFYRGFCLKLHNFKDQNSQVNWIYN